MRLILFLTLLMIIISCNSETNFENEKQEIMILHDNQRKAHMEKDVLLLLGDSIADYVEVNRGLI